nr:hypothetical protein [uncultured Sphaerochaeta sp.]
MVLLPIKQQATVRPHPEAVPSLVGIYHPDAGTVSASSLKV